MYGTSLADWSHEQYIHDITAGGPAEYTGAVMLLEWLCGGRGEYWLFFYFTTIPACTGVFENLETPPLSLRCYGAGGWTPHGGRLPHCLYKQCWVDNYILSCICIYDSIWLQYLDPSCYVCRVQSKVSPQLSVHYSKGPHTSEWCHWLVGTTSVLSVKMIYYCCFLGVALPLCLRAGREGDVRGGKAVCINKNTFKNLSNTKWLDLKKIKSLFIRLLHISTLSSIWLHMLVYYASSSLSVMCILCIWVWSIVCTDVLGRRADALRYILHAHIIAGDIHAKCVQNFSS